MPTRIIAAAVAAIVLAFAGPAFAQTHARHHGAQHRSYGAQGSYQGRYYDVVPGPNVVLPNFGPVSGEDVSSPPFTVPQGQGR